MRKGLTVFGAFLVVSFVLSTVIFRPVPLSRRPAGAVGLIGFAPALPAAAAMSAQLTAYLKPFRAAAEIADEAGGRITFSEALAIVDIMAELCDADFRPAMLRRMARRESRWTPRAVGAEGERGILQVKPATAAPYLRRLGLTADALFDPVVNVRIALLVMRQLRDDLGDRGLALAAYAGGPTKSIYYARDIIRAGEGIE